MFDFLFLLSAFPCSLLCMKYTLQHKHEEREVREVEAANWWCCSIMYPYQSVSSSTNVVKVKTTATHYAFYVHFIRISFDISHVYSTCCFCCWIVADIEEQIGFGIDLSELFFKGWMRWKNALYEQNVLSQLKVSTGIFSTKS